MPKQMTIRELQADMVKEQQEKQNVGKSTITHVATNEGERNKHGDHIDLIDKTEFGSHQTRVDPDGNVIDQDINLSKRHTPGTKVGKYTCGADGLPIRGYNDGY